MSNALIAEDLNQNIFFYEDYFSELFLANQWNLGK